MLQGFITIRGAKGPDIVHQEPVFNNDASMVGNQAEIDALSNPDFVNSYLNNGQEFAMNNQVQSYFPTAKNNKNPRNLKVVFEDNGAAVYSYKVTIIIEVEETNEVAAESTHEAIESSIQGLWKQ